MTAYELRSSDWRSDVCSSDRVGERRRALARRVVEQRLGLAAPPAVGVRAVGLVEGRVGERHGRAVARLQLADEAPVAVPAQPGHVERKRGVMGTRVSLGLGPGGGRFHKKKTQKKTGQL